MTRKLVLDLAGSATCFASYSSGGGRSASFGLEGIECCPTNLATLKSIRDIPSARVTRRAVLDTARDLDLLGGQTGRSAAGFAEIWWQPRRKTSITSDTELLESALAKVALEDDFGTRLIRRKRSGRERRRP
jgi:hypothetical protein